MEKRTQTIFNLNDAMLLANDRHKDQKDQSGRPYIEHVLAVIAQVKGEYAKMAATLHDTVEDTPTTIEELRRKGCPEPVLDAINLVTHKKPHPSEEEYMADIQRIADSKNQIAIDVKWADLTNNSDRSRIPNPTDYDIKRWQKYAKAKEMLKPLVSKYLLER